MVTLLLLKSRHAFKTGSLQFSIDKATFKGTANQQRIVVGYLENKLFPLPPRKQQQRIVEKIEQLMQLLK